MRSAYLTLILGLLLVVGVACSGAPAPVAPSSPSADLPSWSLTLDGVEHVYGLPMEDRNAQAVKPGTTMSAAELRIYFAVGIVNDPSYGWPTWARCPVYKSFITQFNKQSDATIMSWVVTMEANGYDVPDKGPGVPPKPIC